VSYIHLLILVDMAMNNAMIGNYPLVRSYMALTFTCENGRFDVFWMKETC